MQQVRIFTGREDDTDSLEFKINHWIQEQHVEVLNIVGNIAPQTATSHPNARPTPSDVMVIVIYQATAETLAAQPEHLPASGSAF